MIICQIFEQEFGLLTLLSGVRDIKNKQYFVSKALDVSSSGCDNTPISLLPINLSTFFNSILQLISHVFIFSKVAKKRLAEEEEKDEERA